MSGWDALGAMLRPGATVFIPGTSGESLGLRGWLASHPDALHGVTILGCFLGGMNEFDYAGLHPEARLRSFMLPAAMQRSFGEGRVEVVPRSYSGAAAMIAAADVDLAVVHTALPDAAGLCSQGIAADFPALAWARARRRVIIANRRMPVPRRGPVFAVADADVLIEADDPLVEEAARPASDEVARIAAHVAEVIPDGAVVQNGIGGAPGALWAALRDHAGLRLWSGIVGESFLVAAAAGALAGADNVAGIAYGSQAFYASLAESDLVRFATAAETHSARHMAGLDRFHAVNGALSVDLFGQVNVEWQGARMSSGVGGSPDFTRAALASPGGAAIVALPATARGGAVSRIVARLDAPTVGNGRADADVFVTEFGVARVRNLGMAERARALIAIAHPQFREQLEREWRAQWRWTGMND